MPSGGLVIISCSESDPRIDPARYFNLSTNGNGTSVIKTAGDRTAGAINSLYYTDQSSRIGLIVVVQHTGCAWFPGDVEANIRSDMLALKNSPYVRNEIPVVWYVLNVQTGQLREVRRSVQRNGQDEAARGQVLGQLTEFGPFWS